MTRRKGRAEIDLAMTTSGNLNAAADLADDLQDLDAASEEAQESLSSVTDEVQDLVDELESIGQELDDFEKKVKNVGDEGSASFGKLGEKLTGLDADALAAGLSTALLVASFKNGISIGNEFLGTLDKIDTELGTNLRQSVDDLAKSGIELSGLQGVIDRFFESDGSTAEDMAARVRIVEQLRDKGLELSGSYEEQAQRLDEHNRKAHEGARALLAMTTAAEQWLRAQELSTHVTDKQTKSLEQLFDTLDKSGQINQKGVATNLLAEFDDLLARLDQVPEELQEKRDEIATIAIYEGLRDRAVVDLDQLEQKTQATWNAVQRILSEQTFGETALSNDIRQEISTLLDEYEELGQAVPAILQHMADQVGAHSSSTQKHLAQVRTEVTKLDDAFDKALGRVRQTTEAELDAIQQKLNSLNFSEISNLAESKKDILRPLVEGWIKSLEEAGIGLDEQQRGIASALGILTTNFADTAQSISSSGSSIKKTVISAGEAAKKGGEGTREGGKLMREGAEHAKAAADEMQKAGSQAEGSADRITDGARSSGKAVQEAGSEAQRQAESTSQSVSKTTDDLNRLGTVLQRVRGYTDEIQRTPITLTVEGGEDSLRIMSDYLAVIQQIPDAVSAMEQRVNGSFASMTQAAQPLLEKIREVQAEVNALRQDTLGDGGASPGDGGGIA